MTEQKECEICGEPVDSEAVLHFHDGWAAYRLPGEVGVLHRHNGANWGKARRTHVKPSERRKQKAQDAPEIDGILDELGGSSEVMRLLVNQAIGGSATALREVVARAIGAADSEAFNLFRAGKGVCPTCLKWPHPTIEMPAQLVADMMKRHDTELTWSFEHNEQPSDKELLELGKAISRMFDGAGMYPEALKGDVGV